MTLYNGETFTEVEERNVIPAERKYPSRKDSFKEQTLVLSLTGFDLERSSDNLFKSNSATKNVSELSYCIDSLNTKFKNRVAFQFKEFNNSKLYVVRNYLRSFAVSADTTVRRIKPSVFKPYELLDTLPVNEKINALERAIESLKNGSSYLAEQTESLDWELRFIKKFEIDLNKKLTLSFACIIFFFIGAPLGAIIRKGGLGTPAVVSILFFVIWYVLSLSGEKLAEANHLSTITGMWASSYILFPVGLFLTYKASNDSVIMNIDTYLVFLKNTRDFLNRLAANGTRRFPDFKNKKQKNERYQA
jgi:lipopolysaccharide export system permease protein